MRGSDSAITVPLEAHLLHALVQGVNGINTNSSSPRGHEGGVGGVLRNGCGRGGRGVVGLELGIHVLELRIELVQHTAELWLGAHARVGTIVLHLTDNILQTQQTEARMSIQNTLL